MHSRVCAKYPVLFTVMGVLWSLPMCAAAGTPLTGCASHTPPFVIMKDGVGVGGFSFDLLGKMAQDMGQTLVVKELPWARCLRDVAAGRIDVAIDAYDDAKRRKVYLYSAPYYTLTPQIFYRTNDVQTSWPLQALDQLKRKRGCGIREYTYEHYGLIAADLDQTVGNDEGMLKMLKAKRCDYAVEELEYIMGGRISRPDWPDESDLKSYKPAWAQGPKLHLLVGRDHAQGSALVKQMDAINAALAKSGVIKALAHKYFGASISDRM